MHNNKRCTLRCPYTQHRAKLLVHEQRRPPAAGHPQHPDSQQQRQPGTWEDSGDNSTHAIQWHAWRTVSVPFLRMYNRMRACSCATGRYQCNQDVGVQRHLRHFQQNLRHFHNHPLAAAARCERGETQCCLEQKISTICVALGALRLVQQQPTNVTQEPAVDAKKKNHASRWCAPWWVQQAHPDSVNNNTQFSSYGNQC